GAQGANRLRFTDRFERFTTKAPGFAGGYLLKEPLQLRVHSCQMLLLAFIFPEVLDPDQVILNI
ncbi:MAG: hypothetical protein JAY75_11705, partial [Candidatus Thiodiazotropha taylori]|nr:hypothetical protein [Candidatus Thiodiazotropha taylori]MCW4308883.1 hypothetical protein [Candidatus Thiodiazotropha endolucinida]